MAVFVQQADFDAGQVLQGIRSKHPNIGAVVSFIGQVREMSDQAHIGAMTLEYYPGMTEKSLQAIVEQAMQRWQLVDVEVIHRVGTLHPTDQIVMVAVASAHRQQAFEACAFIMDFLKTEAPFWKKEETSSGSRWVEAKESDELARQRWQT